MLYMIRHGEPAAEFVGRFYGQMDVPLSERGIAQSEATAERLAGVPFDCVYSSDLERARIMARGIGDLVDLPVRELEVFRERTMGDLQGVSEEELRDEHPEQFALWKADPGRYRPPNGESYADLQERIVPAIESLVETFQGSRIVLSIHAGCIRATLAHVLGVPIENLGRFVLDYGSINVIEFRKGESARVRLMNG